MKKTFAQRLEELPKIGSPYDLQPIKIILKLLNRLKEVAKNPDNIIMTLKNYGSDLVVNIKYCHLDMIYFNLSPTNNGYPIKIYGNNLFESVLIKSKKQLEDEIIRFIESQEFAQKMALAKIFDN